jgi:putative hydrolase of the HAD superfamily
MSAGKLLPRAMLIDMDDSILSSHGRPEIAWANADASWRLKLAEARHLTVKSGFAALAAAGHRALPDDLAMSLAGRFTSYREEDMSICPGAHDAIDRLKALGVKLALVTKGAADTQRTMLQRFES